MSEQRVEDRIQVFENVPASTEAAFRAFVDRFSEWWPPVYTFAGDDLVWIGLEPRVGGRCTERDQDGNELDWGEVLEYQPGERIVFSWWIAPDRTVDPSPERASEIEVRFVDVDGGEKTRVELEHRNLSRHSGDWQMMQSAMASSQGWPWILQRYREIVTGRRTRDPGR